MKAAFFSLLLLIPQVIPQSVQAGFFSVFTDLWAAGKNQSGSNTVFNSQNIPLLKSNLSPSSNYGRGGGDIAVVDGSALVAESGPLGTIGNIHEQSPYQKISLYTVHSGDTISEIAKMFGVSVNTIVWANDLAGKSLLPGQTLIILPISGIAHTAKEGETLKAIAKKYKADLKEIAQFNDLDENAILHEGDIVTLPEGEAVMPPSAKGKIPEKNFKYYAAHDTNGPYYPDYYLLPVNGVKTQGLHGYNAIDIGAAVGTPIFASAAGQVIISRSSGWNGGYGNYVVINHSNGSQTLYGHMHETIVSVGESVYRGQIIGYVGATGRSTGPHLHFEIRGAKNPF